MHPALDRLLRISQAADAGLDTVQAPDLGDLAPLGGATASLDAADEGPLRVERLYEQVTLAIARGIQRGQYPPGTTLPSEADLAQRFGVGRLVVREALRVLAAKGLLSLGQGKAARVEPQERWNVIDPLVLLLSDEGSTLREVFDLRRWLEPAIAAAAAERAAAAGLAALDAAHERLRRNGDPPAGKHFEEVDLDFHMKLAAATGNRLLLKVVEPLGTLFRSARVAMSVYVPDTVDRSRAAHQRILDAVHGRDPQAARAAMEAHLDEVAEDLARTEAGLRASVPVDAVRLR
jgi:DNA-binding FadR family transcriptional regulator